MNLGKLNEKCPKCGSKDKTLRRQLDREHRAFGKTQSFECSDCGYVFKKPEKEKEKDE
ncbi:MAG: TIGR04165 family Cys-rich peptide [Methanobacterium sp.]|nr:TIGR04165 family Cys-rich peptide [Methanobacterium sp.]